MIRMKMDREMLLSMVENFITGICIFELKGKQLTPLYTNEGLSRMLGYSQAEMERYLKNVRFSIIPDDLKIFEQAITDTLKADGPVDVEFRTVTGKGSIRWLQVRTNLYSKTDDSYIILCVVIDATERKSAEEELQIQAERMNLLSQSARDKILDYNAKTDVMTVRSTRENGLPTEKILPGYIENFDLRFIHPEDAELFLDVFRGLLISPKNEVIEIRSSRFDEDYTWYQLNLTSIAGIEGYVTRIVGRMINVHEVKVREQELQALATTDGLTQIYNRSAVVDGINSFFKQSQGTDAIHAFMIIDLDNFKSVNDCLGHSYGDRILQECAAILMKSFKRLDIVGRIGGDEFVVLAKDLEAISNADILATKLVERLKWSMPYQNGTVDISGSIGIAIYPYHGTTYEEIFDKADEALYSVKANGKSGYRIYQSAATRAYHMNRQEEQRSFADIVPSQQSLEDVVLQMLYEGRQSRSALHSALEMILLKMDWQRGWFCPSAEKIKQGMSVVSACANGYEAGEDAIYTSSLWEQLYEERQSFAMLYEYDIVSEELRRYMLEKGVKRILYYPFSQNGVYAGCVVLEDCLFKEPETSKEMLTQIQSVCRLLDACVIQFAGKHGGIRELITELRMIDDMDQYVYLVDAKTHALEYVNKKVQKETPDIRLGEPCYRMLRGEENPCADCIMKKLDPENPHDCCSGEAFNFALRVWTKQSANWVWSRKDSQVCMITGTDISEYFIG